MKQLKQMLYMLALMVGIIFIAPISSNRNNAQGVDDSMVLKMPSRDAIKSQIMSDDEIAALKHRNDSMDRVGNKIVKRGELILNNSRVNAKLADSAIKLVRRNNRKVSRQPADTVVIYVHTPAADMPKPAKDEKKWWEVFNRKNR